MNKGKSQPTRRRSDGSAQTASSTRSATNAQVFGPLNTEGADVVFKGLAHIVQAHAQDTASPGAPHPYLDRDLQRWSQDIRDMATSGQSWQLITSFNEWGEGTSVEGATQWATPSGQGAYLDALHAGAR
jgi:hypothetical protein